MAFNAPDVPDFKKYDIGKLNQLGAQYDILNYRMSDKAFRQRHRPLLTAEHLFEDSVLNDQQGNSELMPAVQNEFMRGGLTNALNSFGDSSGTLAPGGAGEASVARNLGLSILDLQDRNRRNRQASLALGESLFPRRSYGISGQDAVNLGMANTAGENNYNMATYANQFQLAQALSNQGIAQGNANAAASAQKQQAAVAAGTAVLSAAVMAAAMSCWIARAVFGETTNEWRIFRMWLMLDAPRWFRKLYLRFGSRIAEKIAPHPFIKSIIKKAFMHIVSNRRRHWRECTT